MKTELEKKLNKLPEDTLVGNTLFVMFITKHHISDEEITWCIEYKDEVDNTLLSIEHTSLQAAVDTTLKEIKNL